MDDKSFALLAATFTAVICMAIVQFFGPDSPMVRRRRERERSELYSEMWNRGRWFPPATGEPPPAPPAPPPVPSSRPPEVK